MRNSISLSLVLVAALSAPCLGGNAATPGTTLSAVVKPIEPRTDPSTIEIGVEITNPGSGGFDITTIIGKDPFFVHIRGKDGTDIDKRFAGPLNVNSAGVASSIPLHFEPHETKVFYVKVVTVKDENGADKKIPPGIYNVSVNVPILPKGDPPPPGLVKSNSIEIVVK